MRPSHPPAHHRIRLHSTQYIPQEFPFWGTIKGYCIVLYCIVLYCIVLYCIVLYCIVLYCIVLHGACFFISLDCPYQHLSMDTHPTVSSIRKHRKHLRASSFYRHFDDIVGELPLITMTQRTHDTSCTHIKLSTICRASYKTITNGFIYNHDHVTFAGAIFILIYTLFLY